MRTNEMQAPLPVITAHIADRRDRGYLAWVAVANEVATLQLDAAPIDATPHALEIHVAGFDAPLVVVAEPAGEPTGEGFPLRLRPFDDAQADALRLELFGGGEAAAATPRSATEPPPPSQPERRPIRSLRPASEPPPMSVRHREALTRSTLGGGPPSSRREERRQPGALVGRVIGDGRFSLESLLGAGASGEVYRGTHAALRRPIAVKVLHPTLQNTPDYCARFYSEALAASQLDHRNVMRVIDYGQEPDGLLYIVMELLEGQSLEAILHQEGPMPTRRIANLIAQACAGLAHAHDAGVVHRDIKPENIVVVMKRDDEGRKTEIVKVCDFGIAHWQPRRPSVLPSAVDDDADTLVRKPDDSKVVGTPAYMAPEQIRNDAVDARADVYALGVVIYELATGRVPFDAESPMEVLMQHLNVAPLPPSAYAPDIDPALERIVMTALEKDPDMRQDDARVLRAELRAIADDDSSTGMSAANLKVSLKNLLIPNDFLEHPADTLARLSTIQDAHAREVGIDALGQALEAAVTAVQIPVAKELLAWLKARIADPSTAEGELEQLDRAQRVLRDPRTTATLASAVLDGRIARVEDAAALLAVGGPVAARALVEVRKAMPATLEHRARFVAALRSIGAPSLPAIVAALEPLITFTTRSEEALAEDLLRGLPDGTPADGAGEVTVRFVRVDKPALAVLAIAATTAAWGRRAAPLLVGVLDSSVEVMRAAALEALCKLGELDDSALERLGRLVQAPAQVSDELKVKAATAYGAASPESRARAIAFLQQRLQPAQGIMSSVRQVFAKGENPAITVALARSLVALDPSGARPVLERLAASRSDLRYELEELTRS